MLSLNGLGQGRGVTLSPQQGQPIEGTGGTNGSQAEPGQSLQAKKKTGKQGHRSATTAVAAARATSRQRPAMAAPQHPAYSKEVAAR